MEALADNGNGSYANVDDMDEAFRGADAVYPKSWGPIDLMAERVGANAARDAAAMAARPSIKASMRTPLPSSPSHGSGPSTRP